MYIERVPNRNSPPAILLRESYRENGKVKKRTLLNISDWPPERIEAFRAFLKGGTVLPAGKEPLAIKRALPHGHVAAVLGTLRKIGLDKLLPTVGRDRDLVIAMIANRLIEPASKLATARALSPETATSSLGAILGLGEVDENELYSALDWLYGQQPAIENALAKRHLKGGSLVLYDVSSSYLEGECCELGQRGYSRDHRKDKLQIVYGLLCAADGCPIAIEVFDGNTGDPTTLSSQVDKLKRRFGLDHVVLVGAIKSSIGGMITQARIDEDLAPAGLDWITALRAPALQQLAGGGHLQLSLFDERNIASVTSPDFPRERLIVCRNPALAKQRTHKREDLIAATERELAKIEQAVNRTGARALRGKAEIALKVGAVLNRKKVAKHFRLTIEDDHFAFERDVEAITEEAALDGLYAVRTSLAEDQFDDQATVRAYKSLARVERAFRALKSVDLAIRPVHHRLAPRVRAHVFVCMLAYYVEWHMRQSLAPLLYDETDHDAAEAMRDSAVDKARPSPEKRARLATRRTADGHKLSSFPSLIAQLATLTRNITVAPGHEALELTLYSKPTDIQTKAFELLGIDPSRTH